MRACLVAAAMIAGCAKHPPCDPTKESCTFAKDVSTLTVAAGHEDEDTCQSWTLNNPTELWVNSIAQHNGGAYHHANWFFVPDDQYKLPDGIWSCANNSVAPFDEVSAALEGGYLFALSTQSHDETQQLPTGDAIRIPPYSRLVGASHLLNSTDSSVTSTMHLAFTTIPLTQVTGKLAPARIQFQDLHIDPNASSSFTTECDFDAAYANNVKQPFQYQIAYTLTHYHALGAYQQLEVAGGPNDGMVIMRHDGVGNNAGTAIDPPVDLAALGAHGVRLTCGYTNPRAVEVGWGIGDQEMCVIAIQAITQGGWVGDVTSGSSIVGTATNGEIQHAGPCSITVFPWDFNKPGGQGH
jgi:hypothetical protein